MPVQAWECEKCDGVSAMSEWVIVQSGPSGGYISCPKCGGENGVDAEQLAKTASEQPPPKLTRDALLAEISRSLRATHPERAEKLLAEIERRIPQGEPASPEMVPLFVLDHVKDVVTMANDLATAFPDGVAGGPLPIDPPEGPDHF